ncbi:UDP-N-acetylmuramoylalanyl-D-glutamate--2,6-diaminopimelate ligase [Acetitomaculum ruminis DSM 5522]|uniref:UDP-N-acetylmuramoyl-L-alanyl-D-glutamate--2,6-diaminopimelate ligase n=1 Tax=Acetitomaculum ruminis DSM 5522 TaxID=1120918 RepID=A0A1I0XTF7_9FIRM|nr:UDP-N-acetylmuramoyl-L-alanyl-D-glutamate--2,6-diaminopimelate ligase [Acetitomaculum ruminis]SFB04281.1 UDP-N-acetylmuramoylalanyl-D-glutamate--2,6-diaminopimelate ligase [Acetitomaculum ruminis DSM 5522]
MYKLEDLLERLDYELIQGTIEAEVNTVVYDSRKAQKGCLFVAIKGAVADGHKFIEDVCKKGCKVVVVEDEVCVDDDVTVIKVDDTRYALACISAAYFGYPAEKLHVIGITGTKGKTTTTYMIKSILDNAGHKTGLIGTIESIIGDERIPSSNTTPESYTIHEYLRKMYDAGCDSVVMEVSSQGLMLNRTAGILFEIGIFTNISPDHIGPAEHKDFEEYLKCKSLLFKQCKVGFLNIDDDHYEDIVQGHRCSVETFGFSDAANIKASDVKLINEPGRLGVDFKVSGLVNCEIQLNLPGKFSVYNALAAVAVCRFFEIDEEVMKKSLLNAKAKGRIERVEVSNDFDLMIDYAHNAMSLKSILTTLREYQPKRLVCVFGCGGNRDKRRRYEMGEISGEFADFTIITSDNPRFEEPQDIIDDIKVGIKKTNGEYIEICDRKEAIAYAINNGKPGDVIVLAGKGHEDYQEIKGVKYPMDERVLIQEILSER